MSTRYASFGTGIRRSPKTSVILPWYRRSRVTTLGTGAVGAMLATYGTTAHTKGGWQQVTASTSDNVSLIQINSPLFAAATDTSTLLDIGVGAAGSEVVVVPDVAIGAHNNYIVTIPVAIPAGSRVAVRIQGTRTSPTVAFVYVALLVTNDYGTTPTSVDILGVTTASSSGTAMTGASLSWTEITASTAKDYQQIVIVPSSSSNDIANVAANFALGVGADGSEVVIGNALASYTTNELVGNTSVVSSASAFPLPTGGQPVPAGSRLAIRHNITANPGRYHVCLIGIPYV